MLYLVIFIISRIPPSRDGAPVVAVEHHIMTSSIAGQS